MPWVKGLNKVLMSSGAKAAVPPTSSSFCNDDPGGGISCHCWRDGPCYWHVYYSSNICSSLLEKHLWFQFIRHRVIPTMARGLSLHEKGQSLKISCCSLFKGLLGGINKSGTIMNTRSLTWGNGSKSIFESSLAMSLKSRDLVIGDLVIRDLVIGDLKKRGTLCHSNWGPCIGGPYVSGTLCCRGPGMWGPSGRGKLFRDLASMYPGWPIAWRQSKRILPYIEERTLRTKVFRQIGHSAWHFRRNFVSPPPTQHLCACMYCVSPTETKP